MRALVLAGLLVAGAAHAAPQPVTGRWLTPEGKAIVEIAPCPAGNAAQLCGRIARVLKPRPGGPAVDSKNPDQRLRTRPIEGIQILTGLAADGDAWKGRVYDPESGRTYRAEVTRAGNRLKMKGCLMGPLCRTQEWTQTR